jgi:hypothetical protein
MRAVTSAAAIFVMLAVACSASGSEPGHAYTAARCQAYLKAWDEQDFVTAVNEVYALNRVDDPSRPPIPGNSSGYPSIVVDPKVYQDALPIGAQLQQEQASGALDRMSWRDFTVQGQQLHDACQAYIQ